MHRGEVWLINLDPTLGAEIRKTRPAVIVNDDGVAPRMVRIEPTRSNGLGKLSAADAFQVRSVAKERFVRQMGTLSDGQMWEMERSLAVVLHIE